jgi:hypothetical protein
MLSSIDKIWNEPVVVHIGNHPYNNHTLEKRAKQLAEILSAEKGEEYVVLEMK